MPQEPKISVTEVAHYASMSAQRAAEILEFQEPYWAEIRRLTQERRERQATKEVAPNLCVLTPEVLASLSQFQQDWPQA